MPSNDERNDLDFPTMMKEIKHSDLSEAEKVAAAFDHTTKSIVEHAQYQIDLARAEHDQETIIKQQVKMETIKHARAIFQSCFQLVLGRKAWDE